MSAREGRVGGGTGEGGAAPVQVGVGRRRRFAAGGKGASVPLENEQGGGRCGGG